MKRIIAFILAAIFLFSSSTFVAFSEEITESTALDASEGLSEEENSESLAFENILSYSCYLDLNTQMVNIKGTMKYDAFTSHRDSVFVIYAVPPGREEKDVLFDKDIKPIAEASVSITFAFSFEIKNIIERYSRYAIFMRSPEGEYTLTTKSQYPEVKSQSKKTYDKDNFKGVLGNYNSFLANSDAKKIILPVYLDSLISEDTTKYAFEIEKNQIFFNAAYLENLDLQMQSLEFSRSDVYLQFLIRPNSIFSERANEDAEYVLPNTFNYKTITLLHGITAFLTARYNSDGNHKITGILIGKAWDNAPKYNSFANLSLDDYVKLCGQYTAIISNAAWAVDSDIDIAISFSADGFLKDDGINTHSNLPFSSKELIKKLMQYFDESSYSGIPCSIFVEVNTTPFNFADDELNQDIELSNILNKDLPNDKFFIGNQKILSDFFAELADKYKSATTYYNIIWAPREKISGNALCLAYSYAFYSLYLEKNVIGFIADFSLLPKVNQINEDIFYVLKNIDTDKGLEVTENILKLFSTEKWKDVFDVSEIKIETEKKKFCENFLTSLPDKVKGEFCYFNFSNEFLSNNWYAGVGCTDIKIDYSTTGVKALHSDFSLSDTDICEIIYNYDFKENISYTPYIKLNFDIVSVEESPLYEIKFVLQNEDNTFESKAIVKGNQRNEIILDFSNAEEFSILENVKISIRSLDDKVNACSLWLYDVVGYSTEHNSDKLQRLIEEEREKIKQEKNEEIIIQQRETIVFVVVIIAVSAVLGIVLSFLLQRNGKAKSNE